MQNLDAILCLFLSKSFIVLHERSTSKYSDSFTWNFFSTEEYERLTQTTPVDSSVFLSILCEKGVSVRFLLEQLRLLPCQCSWKVLNNYLCKFLFLCSVVEYFFVL